MSLKKHYSFFILLSLVMLLLAACGQTSGQPAVSQSSVQSNPVAQSAVQPVVTPAPAPQPEPEPPAKPNHTLYILMYHDIAEDGTPCNNWTTTVSRLREDLKWLRDHGYTTVLPRELAAGQPLPQKAVMITFDDGYESNFTLGLPIFSEFDSKCVISLITHHQEDRTPGFLTWSQCKAMQLTGLVEFGSHTHNLHTRSTDPKGPQATKRLPGESREEYEARVFPDLQTSIDLIREHLGQEPTFLAYPHGIADKWELDFVAEHFKMSVTTKHGPANLSKGLYNLRRHNITVENPPSKYLPA